MIGRDGAPKQGTPPPQLEAPQRQEPAPEQNFQVAVLDLRLRGKVRGQGQGVPPDAPVLPVRWLDRTVYLPIGSEEGSEEGEYEIAVGRKQGESLVIARGTARLADSNVMLETRLDFSSLDPGSYLVGLRRGGGLWSYFPVQVE